VLRGVLFLVAAVWSVLLLLWLILHWGILPHIDQWRGAIEARASATLGVPVRIGQIEVSSSSWVPSLEMRQVVLQDPQARPALVLPRVVASLAPQSLLRGDLRFRQLYIEGAQLEIRRDARGRIYVAGFDVDSATPDPAEEGAAVRWFLKQPELVVRGGSLRWTDEQRGAPPLALTDVQLVMRNGLRGHALQLDATPPADWGERFSLRGRFTRPLMRGDDYRRWSGSVYADLPHADVRELQRYVSLPFAITEGDGAVRAWVDLREGVPEAATVDLALRAVSLTLADGLQPLALAQVEGRLVGRRQADGGSLEVKGLGFHTADGLRWPRGDLKVAWKQRAGQAPSGGDVSAQQLDLGVMARVAAALPVGAAVQRLLAETRPEGVVTAMTLAFDGPPDAPTAYRAKARIDGLSLASHASPAPRAIGRPGLKGAHIELSATERGGEARLQMAGGELEFPGVFDEPVIALDRLDADLQWRIEPASAGQLPRIGLKVKDMHFANADAQGRLKASWSTGAGEGHARGGRYPGQLEIDGELSRGQATRVARYLPSGIPSSVRDYVARAVQGGSVGRTSFRVKGDLWNFPFGGMSARDGEFRIAGQVQDVSFAYLPDTPGRAGAAAVASPWPRLTNVSGELVFDRNTMEIRNARAQQGPLQLTQVQGGIATLGENATLAIQGQVNGTLADMLRFVGSSPVGEWTGQALAPISGSGNGELKLALSIPLADPSKSTVKGSVALAGNELRLQPGAPALANARGRVDFTERGFSVAPTTVRVLGGDAVVEGGSQADGSLRFTAQGTATAEALRRTPELGPAARAAAVLSGQAAYRLGLGVVRGQTEFTLSSNLVGMAVDLPAPLRKPAEAPLALRVQTTLADVVAGQPPRDTLRLELGNLVQAQYLREVPRPASRGGDAPRVLRGAIAVGAGERLPASAAGVAATVALPQIDVDAWQAAARRMGLGELSGGEESAGGGYAPQSVALRSQRLQMGERVLTRLGARLNEVDGAWRAQVEAEQLAGSVEYRPPRPGTGAAAAGRVYARLSRLSLPKREADQVETLLEQQPASVPALDIVVDDFELRGKRLGKVEVEAVNRGGEGGEPREWRLNRLAMTTPEARLSATGSWGAAPGAAGGRRRSVLDFKLELADGGAFLERLGTGRAIRGGKGRLAGQVAWQGSPLSLDYPSLSGDFNVAIESGQFLKAEPGAARLLSVLSMQSLPRRLSLDFRDLFQEGFPFDSITGDVSIAQGVARTNNLRMRGVQAAVLMEGMADVERETQDIRVVVVPEINAGTASLAYAAINPAIGLGTFLAQLVLRKPLVQAGTREFHVSGPWGDPKVDAVERKFTDPVPSLDEASPPAAAASAIPPAATSPTR
jgi:uncharacterized protein (TIGR02099 family)